MNRFSAFRRPFLAPPDNPGSAGTGGSSPAPSGSPASSPASGGAASTVPTPASSGTTPSGSSVAPGVEPPPGAPGSTVPAATDTPDFMSIFDGPSEPSVETPPAPTATPVVAPPVTPAAPAAPAVEATPVAPAVAGAGDGGQPPAGTPPASGVVLDPYDPGGLAMHVQQNEAATIEHVASTMFALSPEDLSALETDVAGTVPRLLARAFVKTQINQMMLMQQIIPEMIKRTTENMRSHTTNEDSFYSAWPQINRAQHGDIVKRYGITYRMMNPTATKEQMIAELGPLILMAAKLPATAPAATAPVSRPAAAHQPSPFTPAIPGPAAQVNGIELSDVEAMFAPRE